MKRRPDPRLRLILAHLEDTSSRLYLVATHHRAAKALAPTAITALAPLQAAWSRPKQMT